MADILFDVASGFYDALNRDRVYSADDMNNPYSDLISEGVYGDTVGTEAFEVYAGSTVLEVRVKAGSALLGGKWVRLAADLTGIRLDSGSSLYPRIDGIFLRVNTDVSARKASVVLRKGTPSESPVAPDAVNTDAIHEFRLANIHVAAGASHIDDTDIDDERTFAALNIGNQQIAEALLALVTEHPELITTVADGSITTAKLANGAVTTGKINDYAVTRDKIDSGAVTSGKIGAGAVTLEKIGSDVIDDTLTQAGAAADAKVTGDEIAKTNNKLSKLGLSVVSGMLCVTYAE